jgi:hypothetical protein
MTQRLRTEGCFVLGMFIVNYVQFKFICMSFSDSIRLHVFLLRMLAFCGEARDECTFYSFSTIKMSQVIGAYLLK